MLTAILSLISMEVFIFLACAQALIWLIVESSAVPAMDPYMPQAKRPPSYNWLNTTIYLAVDYNVPHMSGRVRHSSTRSPERQDMRPPVVVHLSWSNITLCVRFDVLSWCFKYLFCKWWHVRNRPPSRTTVLALSASMAGVAWVSSAMPTKKSSRAVFDSNSFDIFVDGSATACISNNLGDFVKPPKTSSVCVKGFDGTTSSTKVGMVRWAILDDSGRRHNIEVP
jgi:hypothetical protein